MKQQFRIEKFMTTVYSYAATAFLGIVIISFASIFFQSSDKKVQSALYQWLEFQGYYILFSAVFFGIIFIFLITNKTIKSKQYILNYLALKKQSIYLSILIVGMALNYILYLFLSHQNIIELINLVLAILSLHQLSKVFFVKEELAWYHPTTQGTFYISAGLLGISQILIFQLFKSHTFNYVILILLIIEILRLTTRFRFLSKSSYETNMLARMLLGKYGIYFGVRVVAGIFMPVTYTVYSMLNDVGLLQGVGALIIIGEFLERLLFIYISDIPHSTNSNQKSADN